MAVLGEAYELNADSVDAEAIKKLRSRVNEEAEAIYFDCSLCGARRTSALIDPGLLLLRDYTCADSKVPAKCKKSGTTPLSKRSGYFVPGSLVLCQLNSRDSVQWPGIIEDCPDGTDSYKIPGKTSDEAKAYFVTFILTKGMARRWLGGFMKAKDVVPFELTEAPANSTNVYKRSISRASNYVPKSLAERLLEFSFVAHVASLRDSKTKEAGVDRSETFGGKRKSCSSPRTEEEENDSSKDQTVRPAKVLKPSFGKLIPVDPKAFAFKDEPKQIAAGGNEKDTFVARRVLVPRCDESQQL